MLEAVSVDARADDALARAQGGDSAAFADLVRAHQAMVFSLACRVVGDRSTAEELAQEVFLRLYRSLPRVESAVHLTFWLRRVTSHCCIDWFRRNGRREEVAVDELPEAAAPPVSRDVLLEERLRRLVRQLPPNARLIVTLRYQEDLDPSEIAAVLDVSVNTVKSRLRRSVELLRARLAESGRCQ
jgi:RNA polymerase sigma-70 factor (ECF subfamily)